MNYGITTFDTNFKMLIMIQITNQSMEYINIPLFGSQQLHHDF